MVALNDKLPDASFQVMTAEGPAARTTQEVFGGRTVALFAVPGAFTPTCSAQHLPGFLAQAEALKAKGVDAIACTAVNDVFVLDAWAKDQSSGDVVEMLADGDGSFARALDLELPTGGFGGPRSRRYSMLVKDGVVTQLNLEEGGGFEVSSAEHMLEQL